MFRSFSNLLLVVIAAVALAGCSHHETAPHHHGWKSAGLDPFAGTGSPYYRGRGKIPFGGGRYQVGNAYQVAGRTFTPHEQPGYDKSGVASWYGEAFHRRKTSNGEWFDMNTLTAAHATLPLPSYAMVTDLDNGRQVVVRINDRGPFVGTRVIDLSKKAADVLGYRQKGTAHVRVRLIGPAPLEDNEQHMMAMNDAMNNGASMRQLASLAENPDARGSVQVARVQAPTLVKQAAGQGVQLATAETPPQQASMLSVPTHAPAGFIVRVGVFHDLDNAKAAFQTMATIGPSQIIRAVGANGPLYRVQVGPLDNEQDARSALETAITSGYEDAKIVETQINQVAWKQ